MIKQINIADYSYSLPPERIAAFPLEERDQSKLLVYHHGTIRHKRFIDIDEYIPSGSTLFFNNTRVIQARLHFEKNSGAVIEIFLLNPVKPSTLLLSAMQSTVECQWKCTIGNLKRWKDGVVLRKASATVILRARLVNREEGLVEFSWDGGTTFAEVIDVFGQTPLPPYLKRDPVALDKERYQTIYSMEEGAVAAPTAGLHFTDKVFRALEAKGVQKNFLTLHVSAGTFQPIKAVNAVDHLMHREQIHVSRSNIEALLNRQGATIAVGTTSMRTLESLYWFGVRLARDKDCSFSIHQQDAYTLKADISVAESLNLVLGRMDRDKADTISGETSIYIMPGYKFRICDGLVTNFHQPNSTLILLVAAFIGSDWKKVYDEALQNDYRFLSYGDSSLLLPSKS